MRLLLLLFLMFSFAFAKVSIDTQIKRTNNKLDNYDKRYKNAHQNLSKSAKDILIQQKKMYELDLKLEQLNQTLSSNLALYESSQKQLSALQDQKSLLTQTKEEMRKELSKLIAKQLSLEIILRQRSYSDEKALMRGEIFTAMSRLTNQELKNIKKNIADVLTNEQDISVKMQELSATMQLIDNKRKNIVALKSQHTEILSQLNKQRKDYKKDLEKSLTTKANLLKMLNQLQIIKIDQEKKAKELAAQKAAEKERRAAIKAGKSLKNVKVIKHGQSYEKVKTQAYRGPKTLSPLQEYQVIKTFGPYVDPVYDIKIFNDSISMKPKNKNAVVRAIFNGKVIISKKNKLLGNFIIIEHQDGLHSIYAHLDRVAQTVKQGQRIRKGSAIGRVDNELMFQITQQNHHVNPLEVIN